MFFTLKKPKCRVANYIRRSFLIHRTYEQVYHDLYWANYPVPLTYLWTKNINPNTTSFSLYYTKNNAINYFKYEIENTSSYSVIPLYDHLKRAYTVIVVEYPYIISSGNDVFIDDTAINVIRTPNNNLYLAGLAKNYKGIKLSYVVLNVKTGKLLYISTEPEQDDKVGTYAHSPPIANSFIIAVKTKKHELNVKVIDLINEKIKGINYDMRKYITGHLRHHKIYYSKIHEANICEIDKSINGVIFYKKCQFVISAYVEDKIFDFIFSVSYENGKIVFSLAPKEDATNILAKREYSMGVGYDISKSYLHAVLLSVGDYALLKTCTMWIGKGLNLYYKNTLQATSSYSHHDLQIQNYGHVSILKANSELMALIQKQQLDRILEREYLILSLTKDSIEVIKLRDILDSMQSDTDSTIFLKVSQAIRKIDLVQITIDSVKAYLGTDCYVETAKTIGQLYSSNWNLYLIVFAYCLNQASYKVLLFVSNMKYLLSNHRKLNLIAEFETSKNDFYDNSLDFKKIVNRIYLISKKTHLWSRLKNMFRMSRGVDLVFDDIVITNHGHNRIYYDTIFNRHSIVTASEIGNVICDLCITKQITSLFSQV